MRIKNIVSIPLVMTLAFTSALGFSYAKPKVNSNQVLAPVPSGVPFFRSERLADSAKPGTILQVKDGVSLAYPIGKVKQIAFVSTNTFGKKIRATATLMVPPGFDKQHSGVLVYNQFVDSNGTKCLVGYSHSAYDRLDRFKNFFAVSSEMISEVYTSAAQNNTAVLMPDADGPDAAFAAAFLEGHIILDAMRAVKHLSEFNLENKKMGVFGYSGGGLMTAWTAALQPKYAPDLTKNITEFLAGGTPVDFYKLAKDYNFFSNKPNDNFGYAAAMADGLAKEYPTFNLVDKLSPNGLNFFKSIKDECLMDIISASKGKSGADVFKSTSTKYLASLIEVVKKFSLIDYKDSVPIKPIHFWHAASDTIIPQNKQVQQLVAYWKSRGVQVDYREFPGDHVDFGPQISVTGPMFFANKLNS